MIVHVALATALTASCSCEPIGCHPSLATTLVPRAWPLGTYTFELTANGQTTRARCSVEARTMRCDHPRADVTVSGDRIESVRLWVPSAREGANTARVLAQRGPDTLLDRTVTIDAARADSACGACTAGETTITE